MTDEYTHTIKVEDTVPGESYKGEDGVMYLRLMHGSEMPPKFASLETGYVRSLLSFDDKPMTFYNNIPPEGEK